MPRGRGLLARPGPACLVVPTPPLFLAPSWYFSGRLVPGLGFVPPAMVPPLADAIQLSGTPTCPPPGLEPSQGDGATSAVSRRRTRRSAHPFASPPSRT